MKRKGLRILLLEDNSSDAVLLKRELSNFWTDAVIEVIYEEQKLISKLKNHKWDIVISDFKMPQMTGLDALKIVRETDNKLPFLMISGTMGEEIAVKVIKAGADDYFLKENLHRLNPAIERALLEREQARHYQEMQNKLADSYFLSDAVIKNSPLGIAVRGRKMRLLHYNAAWQNIWGLTDDEITLQRLSSSDRIEDFYDYAGDYTSRIREVYEKGRELVIPELKLPKNNRLRADWISQHFYSLKNKKGNTERVVVLTEDITNRKNNEKRQALSRRILHILNKQGEWNIILRKILQEIQQVMEYESLAIRLSRDADYPYIETVGFTEAFLRTETFLKVGFSGEKASEIPLTGKMNCFCGKVIEGKLGIDKSYCTENGSFWTNNLGELAKSSEFINQEFIRHSGCIREGYESIALIPMIAGSEVVGLIQINDRIPNIFTKEIIKYLEEIGSTLAMAFQRIQSEKQLKKSEKQFRSLFENTIMGIFCLSDTGKILMMNPCLLELLGYSSMSDFSSCVGSPADDFRRITRKLYNNTKLLSGNIQQFEASWTRNDGENVYVNISVKVIKDEQGKLMYLDGTIEDQTDETATRRELIESRELYRSLVEKANVGIVTDDVNGEITYFNNTFAELFGYSSEEMSLLTYKDLFHPDNIEMMRSYHNLRIDGKKAPPHYEMRGVKKDGSSVFLEISVDHIMDGDFKIIGTRAFLWDVTERKLADAIQLALYNISMAVNSTENLKDYYFQVKKHLSTVIDTTNIFVAMYDKDKDELSLPFEVDEKDHFETFPAGNSLTSYVIRQGKPMLFTEEEVDKLAEQGEIDLIGSSAKLWLGAPLKVRGEIIGMIVVQSYDNPNLYCENDLRILSIVSNEIASSIDKKRAEDSLLAAHDELLILHKSLEQKVKQAVEESRKKDYLIIQQSRQAAIGDMISSIAHHWRQPLNIIGVTFQSLRDAYDYDDLTSEYMEEKTRVVVDNLDSLSHMIDDFRKFHHPDEVSVDFDLRETVLSTIYTVKSKFSNSGIDLITDVNESKMLHGFRSGYSQVTLNILTNAYDILIERGVKNPRVKVKLKINSDKTILSIRDNGGGIDPSIRDKIFDLYVSTKPNLNNTGIGLYTSKLIIEQQIGGKLYAIDHSDGAEFIIEV